MAQIAQGMNNSGLPWVEKYRPRTIDEVTSQSEVTSILKRSLQSANLPHLLFYGPPGTGKTSCVLAMARDLFGAEHYRQRILELNASDERGIQVIREKVKEFARLSSGSLNSKFPSFKLVVLDEADCLTADAQTALRRIMETSVKGTRFILLCNYVTRIIDPLASRCAKFRFRPIVGEAAEQRLRLIAQLENVTVAEDGGMAELVRVTEGDLRRAIQMLQAIHQLGMPLTLASVQQQAGLLPPHHPLLHADNLSDLNTVYRSVHEDLIKPGYSLLTLLQQLLPRLLQNTSLTPLQLAHWLVAAGKAEGGLEAGGDEELLAKSIMGDLVYLRTKERLTLP